MSQQSSSLAAEGGAGEEEQYEGVAGRPVREALHKRAVLDMRRGGNEGESSEEQCARYRRDPSAVGNILIECLSEFVAEPPRTWRGKCGVRWRRGP